MRFGERNISSEPFIEIQFQRCIFFDKVLVNPDESFDENVRRLCADGIGRIVHDPPGLTILAAAGHVARSAA